MLTVLGGDVVAEVAKLKEQPGRELQIHGSGALAQTLFDGGLIDSIRLIVFPIVLGSGKRLFAEGRTPSSFRLAGLKSTPTGVTVHTYERAGGPYLRHVRSRIGPLSVSASAQVIEHPEVDSSSP